MTTEPAAGATPPAPPTGAYPVTYEFNGPDKVANWRPLVHWLLVIPHIIVLAILGIVAEVLVFVGWIVGVITGKIPEGIQGLVATYVRYSSRVTTYHLFLTETYPPFTFEPAFADPGDYQPVRVDIPLKVEGRNRLTIFFRFLMVIPHFFVLMFVGIAMYVVVIIAFFAVLFTGKWPAGLRNFAVGTIRWTTRLNAYFLLLTDEYPPFSLS